MVRTTSSELPFKLDDQRDLAVESMYEYGSRVGIWRLFRVFDGAGVPRPPVTATAGATT